MTWGMTQSPAQSINDGPPARVATALAFSFGLTLANFCSAAALQVSVLDPQGNPVPDIVITVTASDTAVATRSAALQGASSAIMDQINKEFVPEILVVRTGTSVSFPNSDSVAHQVYSFSPVKRFSLPLYRGKPYPPVVFDQAGIATLGCNIHDHMVGYIVVTDTPYFGQTNAQGQWSRDLPPGSYRIRTWHPRLNEQVGEQSLTLIESSAASVTIKLTKPLRPPQRAPTDHRIRDY
jgi:plastocyanin